MDDFDYDEDTKRAKGFDGQYIRVNHSEIEKRRRDKMNSLITELARMVPMCSAMSQKLDKLTVLRMAVQLIKTLKESESMQDAAQKPSFLSDKELYNTLLQSSRGFLFVVGCDRGEILYVSDNVHQILHLKPPEMMGKSFLDMVHPKDVTTIKEQLVCFDKTPREKYIDARTMIPMKTEIPHKNSQICSGARRSFLCRMRMGYSRESTDQTNQSDYEGQRGSRSQRKTFNVIHCTGYIKSWLDTKPELDNTDKDQEACNLSCLVAVGIPQTWSPSNNESPGRKANPIEFTSRHTCDGKFTYIDQIVTSALGLLPQELMGTSVYEHCHTDDIPKLKRSHRKVLQSTGTGKYEILQLRFRTKDGSFVRLEVQMRVFVNPWTKDTEYIIAKNTTISAPEVSSSRQSVESRQKQQNPLNSLYTQGNIEDSPLPISTGPESSRIGKQVLEQVMKHDKWEKRHTAQQSEGCSSSMPSTTMPDIKPSWGCNEQSSSVSSSVPEDSKSSSPEPSWKSPPGPNMAWVPQMSSSMGSQSSYYCHFDYNLSESATSATESDETMAVIMSLLEADAGLGGPIDFSDLPWPL